MTGYDRLGKSEINGVLSVGHNAMEVKLIKEYDDYCEYVRSEVWEEIVFEGTCGV